LIFTFALARKLTSPRKVRGIEPEWQTLASGLYCWL